jgi:SHS2 domain-containing protein
MEYEFFDHTADMMFKAYGKDINEKFRNAAYAMWSIIVDRQHVRPKLKKKMILKSEDLKTLLYNFLEHFLIQLDSSSFLLYRIDKIEVKKEDSVYMLNAEYWGDLAEGYETLEHVKAVTYNSMEVNDDFVQVVLDL